MNYMYIHFMKDCFGVKLCDSKCFLKNHMNIHFYKYIINLLDLCDSSCDFVKSI